MSNALWASSVLSLHPKKLSKKTLSLPVLLVFSIVVVSTISLTSILTSGIFTVIDVVVAYTVFTAFVLWVLQWRLRKSFVVAFFIHGCSQSIWRFLWFIPLAAQQIATLLAIPIWRIVPVLMWIQIATLLVFPIWRILLLWAWIKLISAMVERAEASFEKAVTGIQQLKLINPLNAFDVMIASTVADLERERDAAEGAILAMHLSRFRAERLGSVALTPRELCELMARQCDIFLLIIGERYGHVFEADGISVVEFEYNVALEDYPGKILVYVKDGVKRKDERLVRFLERVQKFKDGRVTWSFSTPEQLAEQIFPDIMRWLTSHAKQKKSD